MLVDASKRNENLEMGLLLLCDMQSMIMDLAINNIAAQRKSELSSHHDKKTC